jgi:Flp pilus assembly protein TadD
MSGALAHWRQALRLKPDWLELMNNLAWALASYPDPKIRNGAEAVQLAERACALSGSNSPPYLDTLAAAYAETGRFADAAAALEKAIALAQAASDTNAAAKFRTRLELYQAQRPYREH